MHFHIPSQILRVAVLVISMLPLFSDAGNADPAIDQTDRQTRHIQTDDSNIIELIKDWLLSFLRGRGYPHLKRAERAFALGNYDKAIPHYQQALTRGLEEPDRHYSFYQLGYAYAQDGQLEKSITAYQNAIELNPTDANAYHQLGLVLIEKKRYDEAIEAFEQAISRSPALAEPHGGLGVVYYHQGKIDEAVDAFITVMKLSPQNQGAPRWLRKIVREHPALLESNPE